MIPLRAPQALGITRHGGLRLLRHILARGAQRGTRVMEILANIAAPAHETIDRIPIALAKILERFPGEVRVRLAGPQDNAPVCRVKAARAGLFLRRARFFGGHVAAKFIGD